MTEAPERASRKIFWGWYVVAGAFTIFAINYGARYCFGVFLKPMCRIWAGRAPWSPSPHLWAFFSTASAEFCRGAFWTTSRPAGSSPPAPFRPLSASS